MQPSRPRQRLALNRRGETACTCIEVGEGAPPAVSSAVRAVAMIIGDDGTSREPAKSLALFRGRIQLQGGIGLPRETWCV
jgi:hypothetical protein